MRRLKDYGLPLSILIGIMGYRPLSTQVSRSELEKAEEEHQHQHIGDGGTQRGERAIAHDADEYGEGETVVFQSAQKASS